MSLLGFSQIDVGLLSAPPEPKRQHRFLGAQSYEATRKSRLSKIRNLIGGTEDDHLDQLTHWTLMQIGRALYRNNSICHGLVDRGADNIVGSGYTLSPRTGDEGLNREVKAYCDEWDEEHADRRGKLDLTEMMLAAKRCEWTDGDVFFFLDDVGIGGRGSIIPLESDRCVTPDSGDERTINGVQLAPSGEPTFYFFTDNVSTSAYASRSDGEFYPAANVIHKGNFSRFSQTRGSTVFASNVRDVDDLDAVIVATRIAAVVAARNGFAITKNVDPADYADAVAAQHPEDQDPDEGANRIERIEDGTVHYLEPGEKLESVGSAHPNEHFKDFVQFLSRLIGVPCSIPLELVLLDFSETNLSAARLSLQQAYRAFRIEQRRDVRVMRRIHRWRIGIAVREKLLPDRPGIAEAHFQPDGWPYIDVLKESRADLDQLEAHLTSRTEIKQRRGEDWNVTLENMDRERTMLADRGLAESAEPSTPRGTGSTVVNQ